MSAPSEAQRRVSVAADLGTGGSALWVRARVVLLRLALEHALRILWSQRTPELTRATMRAQLLVLPRYVDAEMAWRVGELWHALSRVSHHHAYELTPTLSEIERWQRDVETCVAALDTDTNRRNT